MKTAVKGEMLLGNRVVTGSGPPEYAQNPVTGQRMDPPFRAASKSDVQLACKLAEDAFDVYRNIPLEQRALFLEAIAEEILALGDTLIQRAVAESGLPQIRIEGECRRTVEQLRLFAGVVRCGNWIDARIDSAQSDRTPLPRPDLRLRHIPLGPVAVFGASNFPLAFSVAGGDTASALAAGCPVIVKAHPAHPGTSELIGKTINAAATRCGIPEGTFSLIFGGSHELGRHLVANRSVKAVGFTGSRAGGLALMEVAAARLEPIPVYAEMSSINPVFLLPNALAANAAALATGFVSSLTMGAGQFCTNPGVVIGVAGEDLTAFTDTAKTALSESPAQTMLSKNIHSAYNEGVGNLSANAAVVQVASGLASTEPNRCQARIFSTTAAQFLTGGRLNDEVFGATSLIVQCESTDDFFRIAEHLEGQLTATMQLNDDDLELASRLMPILERKAGRILCNAYPTGVEVCHAMVHGGPFPATSDSRTTSVGSAAIQRFLRPICYQDLPGSLLPIELRAENTLGISRLCDGSYEA
jgi:alpha-ketoglutaric semialdehyde dehydrogenase